MPEITLHDAPDAAGQPVRYTLYLPEGWDDERLTGDHLTAIAQALCLSAAIENELNRTEAPDEEDHTAKAVAKRRLFVDLLNLPQSLADRLPNDTESWMWETDTTDHSSPFATEQTSAYRVLPQLDWCWTPPVFERSLLHTLQHAGTEWAGPDDGFTHMTLDQWLWCVQLLKVFRESVPEDSETALNNLLGALYKPRHHRRWNHEAIEERGLRLGTLSPFTKLACVLNFEAIHATLPNLYNRVFDPAGAASQSPQGVFGMAYEVAKSGVYGTEPEVRRMLLHDVMGYMEHSLWADEEAARKAEEQANNSRRIL